VLSRAPKGASARPFLLPPGGGPWASWFDAPFLFRGYFMPTIFTCQSCGARLRVPDSAAGNPFKCPKCKVTSRMSADQDDGDEEPQQKSNKFIFIGAGIAGAGVLIISLVVGIIVLLLNKSSKDTSASVANQIAQNQGNEEQKPDAQPARKQPPIEQEQPNGQPPKMAVPQEAEQPKPQQPNAKPLPGEPVITENDYVFHNSYVNNQIGYDDKYLGKVVALRGFVKPPKRDRSGRYFVTFYSDATFGIPGVSTGTPEKDMAWCFIHPDAKSQFVEENLHHQGGIVIKGTCRGLEANPFAHQGHVLILEDCVLIPPDPNKKGQPAAPVIMPGNPTPKPKETHPGDKRRAWRSTSKSRGGLFREGLNGQWTEFDKSGKQVGLWKEKNRTEEYVELEDYTHTSLLRLSDSKAMMASVKDGKFKPTPNGSGEWLEK